MRKISPAKAVKRVGNRINTEVKKDLKMIENAPIKVYEHLVGERFTKTHKFTVGSVVMVCGVICAKYVHALTHGQLVIVFADVLGYFLHGVGAVPFVEHMADCVKKKKDKQG